MNTPLRISFLLFFFCGNLFAQDTLNALSIQKYSNGNPLKNEQPVIILLGDTMVVRTDVDYRLWEGKLTQITDSTFTMDDTDLVYLADVIEIGCYDVVGRNKVPGAFVVGGAFIVVGGVLLCANGFSPDLGNILGIPVMIVGALIYRVGFGNSEIGKLRKYKINSRMGISATHISK